MAVLATPATSAELSYYFIQPEQLEVTEGKIPKDGTVPKEIRGLESSTARNLADHLFPYAVGDNGETFYIAMTDNNRLNLQQSIASNLRNLRIATQKTKGHMASGTFYLPKPDWSGMNAVKFRINQAPSNQETAKANYLKTKIAHYQRLQILEQQAQVGTVIKFKRHAWN